MTYQWTSAILGLFIAGTIFYLIRRDHLHSRHATWWLLLAFMIAVLGVFPQLIDLVAARLNVNYPPTLLMTGSLGMILVKVLSIDIHQSKQERKFRRLIQRLALLEEEKYKKDQTHEL
ncbi:MAG: DUF2304 domain-containing protein [Gammaproteobacteria bacterium]|nr:DUF2304 domain-containing protein [Gammaproteobacteria bacterium]